MVQKIRISPPLKDVGVSLGILVSTQALIGLATAQVISQEGPSSSGFTFGIAIFTVILSAIVGYAGALHKHTLYCRSVWSLTVSSLAWGVLVMNVWIGSQYKSGVAIHGADMARTGFMIAVTAIFVAFFLERTLPHQHAGGSTEPNRVGDELSATECLGRHFDEAHTPSLCPSPVGKIDAK